MTETALSVAQLSEREAALARHFIAHGDFEQAARDSGYPDSSIPSLKTRVTRKPEWLAAVHLDAARRLQMGAPLALSVIETIVKDTTAPVKVRLDAAKTLLDRAGHIAPRARAPGDGQEKTLGEMSLDELKATQDRLQQEIQSRAKPVNAQPIEAEPSSAVDLLD